MLGILTGVCALVVAWLVTRRAIQRRLLPPPRGRSRSVQR
jgi:hypothetical protein